MKFLLTKLELYVILKLDINPIINKITINESIEDMIMILPLKLEPKYNKIIE